MPHESTADERRLSGRQTATAKRFRVTGTGRCLYAVADEAQPLNQPLTKDLSINNTLIHGAPGMRL
jgi:hypothetical protein